MGTIRQIACLTTLVLLCACNSKSPEQAEDPETNSVPLTATTDPKPAPKPPRPEPLERMADPVYTAFDLLANRPLAHHLTVIGETRSVVADAAHKDFVRYVHGNQPREWNLDSVLEDRPAAALKKKRLGSIWIPSPVVGKGQVHLDLFNPAKGDNRLTLSVNGTESEPKKLAPGWQVVTIETDALALENHLILDFSNMGRIDKHRSGGAIGRIAIGTAPLPEIGGSHYPVAQGPISLTKTAGIAWHVWALPKSQLQFDITAPEGCGIRVQGTTDEGPAFDETRLLVKGLGEKQTASLALGKENAVVRVEVTMAGECGRAPTLEAAGLLLSGLQPVVPKADPPKYVIVWMIDTLRADHLPLHFETNVEAPNLQKLAAGGASFELAHVQGNESKSSHASFFAGMYPSKHRVLVKGHLKPFHQLLPEEMKTHGYKTGAYIANGYVSKPWGFVQGWDMYINNLRDGYRIHGMAIAEMGVKWAKENQAKPFLLYLGTIDPHVTYRRHKDLIGKYETSEYKGRFKRACLGGDLGKIKGGSIKVTDRDKVRIENLYKNEITYNDIAFGKLRAGLEEAGIWDQTLIVVTADHGDEFWEHGSVGHGHSVYQELVHVPLLLHYPPLIPKGTVVRAGVDSLDIYPTIIDAIGKDRPDELQGKSLLPLVHKVRGDYPEPAIATHYALHYGIQMEQWKLYLRKGSYKVFDREADPFEKTDVHTEHPVTSRWLLDSAGWFRAHRKDWDKASYGPASNLDRNFLDRLGK